MNNLGLRSKILAAFLAVIASAGVILVITLELTAPNFYRSHAEEMTRTMGKDAMTPTEIHALQHDLERGFNQALTQSLLLAALVTIPLAILVSAFVSRRIVAPISSVSKASARIAAGGYQERLPTTSQDELGQLTENFNRMASVLEQAETRRIELLGTVAHELRTPLSGLLGYSQGMLDGVFSVEHAAPRIGVEVKRLERLLDDLSDLSRVEAGAVQIAMQPVQLEQIAFDLHHQLEQLFMKKNLSLQLETIPVCVLADADRLLQIGHNLLSNALRHTISGTVTIRVSKEANYGVFSVIDTGQGIAIADLPHIFERFYRANKARSRDDESVGAGVGLTIAKHLVEAMQGSIEVKSQLNQGTTFSLKLQISKAS